MARRSAHLILTKSGRTMKVLAYTADYAQGVAAKYPGAVYLGPAPRRAPAGAGRPATWAVDPAGLRAYCRAIGVTWDVKITRTTARGRGGRHRMSRLDFGVRHRITADKLVSREKAERTLRHELQHAAQAERFASFDALLAEHRRQHRIRYEVRPCEVEARAAESNLSKIRLTRPA